MNVEKNKNAISETEFPPFPYDKATFESKELVHEFVSFEQIEANYFFYCANYETLKNTGVEDVDFSVRLYNVLKHSGYITLAEIVFEPLPKLFSLRNLGKKCLQELLDKLSYQYLGKVLSVNFEQISVCAYAESKPITYIEKNMQSKEMSVRSFNVLSRNGLLNEFKFLSMSDEAIADLHGIGSKTTAELICLKHTSLRNNKDYFVAKIKADLQKICAENFVFDLKTLSGEKLYRRFAEIGIHFISDLIHIIDEQILVLWDLRNEMLSLLTTLSNSIIGDVKQQFEWCLISNTHGKKQEKESERNIKILANRASGLSLLASGEEFALTRERVRQIEKKKTYAVSKLLQKNTTRAFLKFLFQGKSYLLVSEVVSWTKYGDIFAFFLKNVEMDDIVFIQELNAFIYGANWFLIVEQFIEKLPTTMTQLDFESRLNELFIELKKLGVVFDESQIKSIALLGFKANGEFLTQARLTLLAKYRTVLERNFADGIDVYDDSELERFRNCYNRIYSDNDLPDNNRALLGRIVANCILVGRGRYALRKETYISAELLESLYAFVLENPHGITMTNTIFHRFERQLIAEGVDNKYFLQGIMRQHNTFELYFTRDYISKSKDKSNVYAEIIRLIEDKQDIIHISEIHIEFPSIPDSVLSIVLGQDEVISVWNKTISTKIV